MYIKMKVYMFVRNPFLNYRISIKISINNVQGQVIYLLRILLGLICPNIHDKKKDLFTIKGIKWDKIQIYLI